MKTSGDDVRHGNGEARDCSLPLYRGRYILVFAELGEASIQKV